MEAFEVHVAANFVRNLDEIEAFLEAHGASESFQQVLDLVFDTLIPNLQRFPLMGRDFMAVPARSAEALIRLDNLRTRTGAETDLREYILRRYLVLYAIRESKVYLLSIRHHRQLSYDLGSHWSV